MSVLLRIVKRVYEENKGTSMLHLKGLKDGYMTPVEELGESLLSEKGKQLMVATRLKLRMYLRELHIYT